MTFLADILIGIITAAVFVLLIGLKKTFLIEKKILLLEEKMIKIEEKILGIEEKIERLLESKSEK